jgi:hypothetical protein
MQREVEDANGERTRAAGSVEANKYFGGTAEGSQHLGTLLSGLCSVVEAKMRKECEVGVEERLALILRKLRAFTDADHYERRLALHTASSLLKLSATHGLAFVAGQHEQIMQVHTW